MKLMGSRRVEVEIDPLEALIGVHEDWLNRTVHNDEAYIKDGFWCADDRYGPDQIMEASEEDKKINDAFQILISHLRKNAA